MSPVESKDLIGKEFWLNRNIRGWGRVQVVAVDEIGDGSIVRVKDLSDNGQYPASRDSLKERLSVKEQAEADRQVAAKPFDLDGHNERMLESNHHILALNREIRILEQRRMAWRKYGEGKGPRP